MFFIIIFKFIYFFFLLQIIRNGAKNMSIAVKQSQQLFHNPNRQLQQQRARTFAYSQQQWNRQKSIDFQVESQEEHVINKTIKHKHFLRQTPVAATETEVKPENQEDTAQSHEIEKVIVTEEENSENKDYQIYQNGKVNEFFQNKMFENPKTISDICLVNDHYILVKMPYQEINPENQNDLAETEAALQKEFRAVKEQSDTKELKKNSKKLCRYLKSKRNRISKIAPIHEEPEELSDIEDKTQSKLYCLKMQSCWQANEQEVEIFQTQTKIRKNISNSGSNGPKSLHKLTPSETANQNPKCIELKKPPDIQTISGSLFKSSLQYQVSLQKHGSLLESHNNNNSKNFELITSPSRRKCPRLERFYWLLHPFRSRYRKPKPKIQAVVYKTYFVKWTKPPDTLSHGYGIKSSKSSEFEVSVLRRCRSATF